MVCDGPISTRLRHVDIHHHWLRQLCRDGTIRLQWVPTTNMPADGLTKALPRSRHGHFLRQLGLTDISSESSRLQS